MDPNEFSDLLGDIDGKSVDTFEQFDMFIKKFGLKQTNHHIYFNRYNKLVINEEWSSDGKEIRANRVYEFSPICVELIMENKRKEILNEIMDKYVESEEYENAAEIRDIIKNIG